jgi:hypothetical protein
MSKRDEESLGNLQGGAAGVPGTRAHLQETIERVRRALDASERGQAQTRALFGRAEELAGESGRLVRESAALRSQLRDSATAYARHLHDDGLPSERMLVLVKAAVREATPSQLDPFEARELMDEIVRWSIEAYYAA